MEQRGELGEGKAVEGMEPFSQKEDTNRKRKGESGGHLEIAGKTFP